jgi:lysozyme family protein
MTFSISNLEAQNAASWAKMTVHSNRVAEFDVVAKKLVGYKSVLEPIAEHCKVPWWAIAVILEREGGGSLNCYLGNGQPLTHRTTEVPRNRGPFKSFAAGCYDALVLCEPYASKWNNWTAGGTLTLFVAYNGYGYAERVIPDPYIFAGTDQYVSGKFVRDDVFRAHVVDTQLGCAGILKRMMALDSSIKFVA